MWQMMSKEKADTCKTNSAVITTATPPVLSVHSNKELTVDFYHPSPMHLCSCNITVNYTEISKF
jgi:hypothetical protein